ncbi:MAG: thioredoxin domain-containing protein [Sphingomonadales bacterium]|nr:thioredoxin domain-containing protein [Sphingomonadales bacterium]MDE2568361.1 thioredoxin domain-containing protein [Sphingomonadales bacterium]
MKIKGLLGGAFAIGAGLLLAAATKPLPDPMLGGRNWNATIAKTDHDSYVLGNPDAKLKLVEFISYTCPHCSEYEQQADAPLRIGMVARGIGSVEVRPFIRNNVDLTAALLAECGDPSMFFMNSAMFLSQQGNWITPMYAPSPNDLARWNTPDVATRNRYIAQDFGFYKLMSDRGYDRVTVDRCLADVTKAKRLEGETEGYVKDPGIQGTPSFMIDGILLAGTYSWDTLRPQIEARIDEMNASGGGNGSN